MKKIVVLFAAFLFAVSSTVNAQDLNAKINNDPHVRIGKLENGMTYYLRKNNKPENRIEFRLAVNVGSNVENDNQQGLAHFTEHMAFNGMEGYPGNELIAELQKIGVRFGADLNAYTGFEETVYMVEMPSDDPKYVDMGLNILKGWASGLLFDSEEIDAERGVITEEYRSGQGANDRMRKKWFPVVLANSRYAERYPIGTLEVIQGFEHQLIKDFYHDWYRPDLQALVIVGDINVDQMEQEVKKRFGTIKALENPRERITYTVPTDRKPSVAVVTTDVETMGNQVMLVRRFPQFKVNTQGDFRKDMMHSLYNLMMKSRLQELSQKAESPIISASAGYGKLVGTVDAYTAQATAKENRIDEAIRLLMREDYRVLQYGFLDSELKRAKEDLMNRVERAANEVDKTESGTFANEYSSHFLYKDPIPGAKREYAMAKRFIDGITVAEINALAKEWITPDNIVAVVMAPEKEGIKVPTEAEVVAVMNDKELAKVEPYVDNYKDQEIVDAATLTPGKIATTKELTGVGAKEITLSNGIKVILKKTDFKNDEILFMAKSKGGLTMYEVEDLASASMATEFVDRSGIAELDFTTLNKKMKTKQVSLRPNIETLSEGLSGTSTPKDLEFFFQYLHAFFAAPRYDESVYNTVVDEYTAQTKMLLANPQYKFFAAYLDASSNHDPYQATILNYTEDFIKKSNYKRAFEIYKERFANPADFNFLFIGNFDEKLMEQYLELYLGSLKTSNEKENFRASVLKDFPEAKVKEDIFAGMDEKSFVGLTFRDEYPWNSDNNMIIAQISSALSIEALETIREKMGGVYSPSMRISSTKYPESSFSLTASFSCAPDNTDKLIEAVISILKNFQNEGPKPETLAKVKEQMIKSTETSSKTNKYWQAYIGTRQFNGDDMPGLSDFAKRVNAVTNDDIVKFMKTYFDLDNYVRVVLYPEAMKK